MKEFLNMKFHSKCENLKPIRTNVQHTCELLNINNELTDNIILAVNEACMNIIKHGYHNDPGKEFRLLIFYESDLNTNEIVIRLIDNACKVDPVKIKSRDLDNVKPGGIGVYMINELMDSVKFIECPDKKGNILELRKFISQ